MKAAIVTKYGDPSVINIVDLPKPHPKPNQVLVKIKAFGVTSGDVRIRSAKFPPGFTIPAKLALGIFGPRKKILGSEFSGVIEEVGGEVKDFKAGDKVMGYRVFDVYAEYTCIKESEGVVSMPEDLSFEEAAGVPFGGSTALYFLQMTNAVPGQTILINGASGAVGSSAVQIARSMGLVVTGVCSSGNAEFVQSLGAKEVIDYQTVDLKSISSKFDVVFDTVGNLRFPDYQHLLNPNGTFLQAVATFGELFAKKNQKDGKRFLTGTAPEKKEDLIALNELILSAKFKPCIDKIFTFKDIIKAHQYVETGRKRGSVVVKFE